MRSLWPLLCILSCHAACTKHSSKNDPAPAGETPFVTDGPASPDDTPTESSEAALQDSVPSDMTPDQPASAPSADSPVATPAEAPAAAPTEPQTEAPAEPGRETPDDSPPTKKSFSWSEEQYWTYVRDGGSLKFNSPWDSEEGDAIQRDYDSQPKYVQACVESAKESFENTSRSKEFATSVEKILQAGATDKLILLVNVVDQSKDREVLRRLDRDAYFWNWPDPKKRPYFALSNFKKGAFVWEIIASQDDCITPRAGEVERYLAYVEKRLTAIRGS